MARRVRRGSQIPTFSTVKDWAYSDGDYAISMFTDYGVRFYESQKHEMRVFLARDEGDDFAARTIGISKPRQNGKSFAARFYAIWMAAIEGKDVLFSAHHGETVRKMFKAIRKFVEENHDFSEMLKPNRQGIYAAKGSEGIYFVDDEGNDAGMIEFQTRTTSGARGQTYQVIVIDEAQELTKEQLDAIKPTTLAATDLRGDDDDEYAEDADIEDEEEDEGGAGPQMIYLGTPPNEKCPGTVFRKFHDRAHTDAESSIWWMEWAVDEIPDMSNRKAVMELVYLTNPAMGMRIKRSTMIDCIDTMEADGFARECLGWWSPIALNVDHAISADHWNECVIDANDRPESGIIAYAMKYTQDGKHGVISVCLCDESTPPYIEVAAMHDATKGSGWFVGYLKDVCETADRIIIDGKGKAKSLYDRLIADGVDKDKLVRPTADEAITAYAGLVDAVDEGQITHINRQGLSDAAKGCGKRPIGKAGGFGFESIGNAEATLLETVALAHWQVVEILSESEEEMEVW